MKPWTTSDISKPLHLPKCIIEFVDEREQFHDFTIVATAERVVFGGVCNVGFIESGYIEREEGESLDECLQELLRELETYYNDGREYVTRIVCNERM
jgi:hypothetical protein